MVEKPKNSSPPYATFSAFVSFINKLRDSVIPSRIDPSVFGNASGSISYSIIASLKFLNLINEAGAPTPEFIALIKASDEDRPANLSTIIQKGYPSLFRTGTDLKTMTAGQFDEHMRTEFGVSGSTVDKIAAFFIGACKMAGIAVSAHLAARKPVAASSNAKKSAKQRRVVDPSGDGEPDTPPPPPNVAGVKALEYQLIDLMSEPDIDDPVKQSIWSLVQYLTARKAKKAASGDA